MLREGRKAKVSTFGHLGPAQHVTVQYVTVQPSPATLRSIRPFSNVWVRQYYAVLRSVMWWRNEEMAENEEKEGRRTESCSTFRGNESFMTLTET